MGKKMMDLKYATHNREPFFEIAKRLINEKSKVLDVGAGYGSFSDYCERKDFYLFDGNEETVKKLRQKHQNSFHGSLPILPFKDDEFDLIHCSHIIEHLTPQELYDSMKEFDRCLRRGGYIVISAPLLWEKFYDDLSHIKPYNPRIFIKYLTRDINNTPTREKISSDYIEQTIQFRYKEVPILESFYMINNNLLIKSIFKLANLLYRIGLRRYIKTGYTLVLRKEIARG